MQKHQATLFPARPFFLCLTFALTCLTAFVFSQAARAADAPPSADTLVFTNGDSLKGKLVSATGAGITFHSDMAGDLTITWDKIKTLDSATKFAVIKNGQPVSRKTPPADVPQGSIAISDKNVNVTTSAGTTTISTSNTQAIVDAAAFQKTVYQEPGILHGYNGAITLGVADVQSTQTTHTFNGALNLVRTVPNAAWITPRNKTILDIAVIYGIQKQDAIPALAIPFSSVKTDILHGDLERDEYVKPRLYYLAYASADHNYSQGLAVQDIFGGGFGFTAIKTPKQELDVKTDLHYEQQQFVPSAGVPNDNLIGMDFAETYMRKLPKNLGFTETGVVTPSFNAVTATAEQSGGDPFSAAFTSIFTFPVYKRLAFNAGVTDSYISNAAPGFNNNSFQFTAGATYAFK